MQVARVVYSPSLYVTIETKRSCGDTLSCNQRSETVDVIGMVTIGQAPRNDITASMFHDDLSNQFFQAGALDGLTAREIASLAPDLDDYVLVTRLADGTEVVVGKCKITPLAQSAIARVAEAGSDAVCVLCTGSFAGLQAEVPIIFPDLVVHGVVDALLPSGRIGVLMPHEDQQGPMVEKWSSERRDVVTAVASPYTSAEDLGGEAKRLREAGAQLLVLDCMGFTREMERSVREIAGGVPVLLSNGIVASVIAEAWGLNNAREDALAV